MPRIKQSYYIIDTNTGSPVLIRKRNITEVNSFMTETRKLCEGFGVKFIAPLYGTNLKELLQSTGFQKSESVYIEDLLKKLDRH